MTERTAYMIEVDGGIWGWNVQRHTNSAPMIFLAQGAAEWWASKNIQHAYRVIERQVLA